MLSFLVSPAYAAGTSTGGFDLNSLYQIAPLVLIFLVFYFLLIRPQQQKQKQVREQQANLRRGDRIVTAGGVLGVVQATREGSPEVDVEIAPNTRVKVIRNTITTVLPRDKPANDA
ncbi:preprotein translocase subunit YajC [Oecophyllibacter saccharovorans]|uniref:Sec translocon accessory complex subunit YajC n=1 Tax=Oecophyllibacter saccharovorans TaxID=2558360 RepID=A0A506UQ41_9PROT|nr:preprotein translocase subunit YajC [Oecophyllibacter saccharovorans]QDH15654.1 preprotein translocase subunit YajC [Oecophyllibacter saccharovorans]TPW35429.1 preprotein translocase subunit YajC [Oecophyllibacter saccharovorans]TPW36671.1 preprotein translocase subunit YajC [Oecophyllibacter saccharovorans]